MAVTGIAYFSFSLGLFASADTAYVLAYSIIMLTTDLHSTQVCLDHCIHSHCLSILAVGIFKIYLLALQEDNSICQGLDDK